MPRAPGLGRTTRRLRHGLIENRGQFDDAVRFALRDGLGMAYLEDDRITWVRFGPAPSVPQRPAPGELKSIMPGMGWGVSMVFESASPDATPSGEEGLEAYVNYFVGDPSRWASRVPTYERARYRELYPGIDAVVSRAAEGLEYDFELRPGFAPSRIRVRVEGAERLIRTGAGELIVEGAGGVLLQRRPMAFLKRPDGTRRQVACSVVLLDERTFGFDVPSPLAGETLVIDPQVVNLYDPLYFTYLGGTLEDVALDVAVQDGKATVTGATRSQDYPVTAGAFDTTLNGIYDVFVTRINVAGTALEWSTFLGGSTGSQLNAGYALDLDGTGAVYVAGFTNTDDPQGDFPVTAGAFQTQGLGSADAFALKLSSDGSSLLYSTLLSGGQEEAALGIRADRDGNAYVTGYTLSGSGGQNPFPTTTGVVEPSANSTTATGFLTKLSPTGQSAVYSTFLAAGTGAILNSYALDVDIDSRDASAIRATVVGEVEAEQGTTDLPATSGGFQGSHAGGSTDAFVLQLNATGTAYVYGSYWGTDGADAAYALDVADSGKILMTGSTAPLTSGSLPLGVSSPFQPNYALAGDAFVARVDPGATANSLLYSSYLGGGGEDAAFDIWVDSTGRTAFVTGITRSGDFPIKDALQSATDTGGQPDAFLTKIQGSDHPFSSYLGGSGEDEAYGVAIDATTAYIVGRSSNGNGGSFYDAMNLLTPSMLPGFSKINQGGPGFSNLGAWFPDRPAPVLEATPGMDAFVLQIERP